MMNRKWASRILLVAYIWILFILFGSAGLFLGLGILAISCSLLLKIGKIQPGDFGGETSLGMLLIGCGVMLLGVDELELLPLRPYTNLAMPLAWLGLIAGGVLDWRGRKRRQKSASNPVSKD